MGYFKFDTIQNKSVKAIPIRFPQTFLNNSSEGCNKVSQTLNGKSHSHTHTHVCYVKQKKMYSHLSEQRRPDKKQSQLLSTFNKK